MTVVSGKLPMPLVAGFVRDMGGAFGFAEIGEVIRQGMAGQPVFFASEQGVEIGTRRPAGYEVSPLLPITIDVKGRR